MATAVTLIDATPTTHMTVKGIVLEGIQAPPATEQVRVTKFFGVAGESYIAGGLGGRPIVIPVIIYDATDFSTAALLATYIHTALNKTARAKTGTLTVTSESSHPAFTNCRFEGFVLFEGPKHDEAGTLGGGYFAIGELHFRQMQV